MSYTPMQRFNESYNWHEALLRGTLFPELDKPFYGKFTGERMR
ncbi:MAG: spore coat associated protein CotJA [Ruminococcaceae bacterium]|nr:spore coat associated protein CotJA [Oscillospiraceae bacterium]